LKDEGHLQVKLEQISSARVGDAVICPPYLSLSSIWFHFTSREERDLCDSAFVIAASLCEMALFISSIHRPAINLTVDKYVYFLQNCKLKNTEIIPYSKALIHNLV
jgi:hypothetical protein